MCSLTSLSLTHTIDCPLEMAQVKVAFVTSYVYAIIRVISEAKKSPLVQSASMQVYCEEEEKPLSTFLCSLDSYGEQTVLITSTHIHFICSFTTFTPNLLQINSNDVTPLE